MTDRQRRVCVSDDCLDRHLEAFLSTLTAARYRESTQQDKRRCLVDFISWLRNQHLATSDIDESCVSTYLERHARRRGKRGAIERATVRQFVEHLRVPGVLRLRGAASRSSADVLFSSYVDHLREARGLADRSVAVYGPFVREFVTAHKIDGDDFGARLDAAAVRGFLIDRARGRSDQYTRLMAIALRSFLRFMFLHEMTVFDLSAAVPPFRGSRLADVPPALSSEEVEQVLAATDRSTPKGRRAYAMLLLLARLGLRPGEIATLDLEDIDWRSGKILVRGKGGRHDRLPLLEDVGEALSSYLRHDRVQSISRRVFLRLYAPCVGFSGPTAVCLVARDALARAGLRPAGRVGAHIFRHSLATQMIRHGASLSEISQALRHRQIASTQIYAKVDIDALRSVARPWPSEGGEQ